MNVMDVWAFSMLFLIFLGVCFLISFFLMLSSDPNRWRIGRNVTFVTIALAEVILLFFIIYAAVSGSV